MENKKWTKEQLREELIKVGASNADWVSGDEARRKEISKMLGKFTIGFEYGSRKENVEVLTWPQIYFEIGKVIAARTFMDFSRNISALELAVENLQKQEAARSAPKP